MKETLRVFASVTGNKGFVWSHVSAVFPPDCCYRRQTAECFPDDVQSSDFLASSRGGCRL